MQATPSIANLAKAMIMAQGKIPAAVVKNADNETFGSRYADLSAMVEAIKPHALAAGLTVIQSPGAIDERGNVRVTTRILHETGEWLEDTCAIPMAFVTDPQDFGKAVSYARRYALAAIFMLYQADDDGNAGSASAQAADQANASAKVAQADPAGPSIESLEPDVAKRVRKWLNTIENATLDRLLQSKDTAKTTFQGDALKIVEKAFETRISKLKAEAQAAQT